MNDVPPRPWHGPGVHPLDRLRMVALGASAAAGVDDPDAHEELLQGIVWVGDLSGWEVSGEAAGQVALHHRCGYGETLRASGICADFSVHVGNVIERVLELLKTHVCAPHQRSPETAAMVQRWEESSGRSPRPVPPGAFPAAGVVDPMGLLAGIELHDTDPDDEGEPLITPPSGYDAYLVNKYVDGPGCTPAIIPPLVSPFTPVPGALRALHDEIGKTAGTGGHGPEDYDQGADTAAWRHGDTSSRTVDVHAQAPDDDQE